MRKVVQVPLPKLIVGAHEQRLDIQDDGLNALAASIGRLGVIVPLVVTPEGDKFLLVAGHRRYRASVMIGLESVPCFVRDKDDAQTTELSFAENFFRLDLSPIELACAIKDTLDKETMTAEQVAAGLHRSKHWIDRQLDILTWPADVIETIQASALSVAAASNLALVTDSVYREFLLRNAVESGATARTTAAWLQAWRAQEPQEQAVAAAPVPAGLGSQPAVPQAPCIMCGDIHRTDALSYVLICSGCINTLRSAISQG